MKDPAERDPSAKGYSAKDRSTNVRSENNRLTFDGDANPPYCEAPLDEDFTPEEDTANAATSDIGASDKDASDADTSDCASDNLDAEDILPRQVDCQSEEKYPVLTRPFTLIGVGDTLVSIAETYFYDPNIAWLIADLNGDCSKQSWLQDKRIVEFKSRQQIVLPVNSDIDMFYRSRARDEKPENLVTIVEETQVDRELLTEQFVPIIGQPKAGFAARLYMELPELILENE